MSRKFPLGYSSHLTIVETLSALHTIKQSLINQLMQQYKLLFIPSPIIVNTKDGLNDDFHLSQRHIDFDVQPAGEVAQILNSTAKWRRWALHQYRLTETAGVITTGHIFHRDHNPLTLIPVVNEECGYDLVISNQEKTSATIQKYAVELVKIIANIEENLVAQYSQLSVKITDQIKWISMERVRSEMKLASAEERINKVTRDNGVVILYDLENEIITGQVFDDESQDVFDWEYYAKVYFYNYNMEQASEIARIGYSVDKNKLSEQNLITKENYKIKTTYDALIAQDQLPLTISCSINVSRLTMFLLEKQHMSEVVSSIWSRSIIDFMTQNNIEYCK